VHKAIASQRKQGHEHVYRAPFTPPRCERKPHGHTPLTTRLFPCQNATHRRVSRRHAHRGAACALGRAHLRSCAQKLHPRCPFRQCASFHPRTVPSKKEWGPRRLPTTASLFCRGNSTSDFLRLQTGGVFQIWTQADGDGGMVFQRPYQYPLVRTQKLVA